MEKGSTTKILGLALASIGALAATTVMAASPVKINGQLQTDFASFSGDSKVVAANGWGTEFNSSGEVRRANFRVSGKFDELWDYQIGWIADESKLDNSFIGFSGFDPVWLSVGRVSVPFGAESWGSSNSTTFMERGAIDNLAPADALGLYGEGHTDMVAYQFAAVVPDHTSKSFSSADPLVVGGRLAFAPVATDDNVYHFGVSYAHQRVDQSVSTSYGTIPKVKVRETAKFVTSDSATGLNVDDSSVWGVEAAGVWGPIYAHTEYARNDANGKGAVHDMATKAWFAQASYMLTGESRSYDQPSGTFGGVKPASNMGAWELGVRYEVFDASNQPSGWTHSSTAGKQKDWTFGVNWYANNNVKMMLDYVRATADYTVLSAAKDRDLNVVAVRAQLKF